MRHAFYIMGIAAVCAATLNSFALDLSNLPERGKLQVARTAALRGVPKDDAPITDIITNPKGKTAYYSKEAAGTFLYFGEMFMYQETFPAIVIMGSNNKVYFKNIISVFPSDYYVEGTIDGNTITVPLNQTIEYSEDEGYGYNFGVFRTVPRTSDGKEYIDFEYAEEVESITYEIADDGSMKMILPGTPFDGVNPPEYVAGLYFTDDYSFTGYCDFSQNYSKMDIEPVEIPEEAQIEPYVYVDNYNYAFIVDVATYDGNLYIKGLNDMLPDAILKAEISDGKAVVPQNQYLGIYFDQFYIFTKVLYDNPDYDPDDEDSPPLIMAPVNIGFELNIDTENKRIYADKPGIYLSFHNESDDEYLSSLGYYGIFELKYQSSFEGTPANPVMLEYTTEFADRQGFNDFMFTLSNFSTDGRLLDVDYLYYRIYVDGKILIFSEEYTNNLLGNKVIAYSGVPYPVQYIPYLFNNNEDIFKFSDNAFDIGLYGDVEESVAVQTVYHYNDVFTYSDLVRLNIKTGETENIQWGDGVEQILDDEVVSTEYYTLDGLKVANPSRGLYIKVTKGSNGTVKTSKVILQ